MNDKKNALDWVFYISAGVMSIITLGEKFFKILPAFFDLKIISIFFAIVLIVFGIFLRVQSGKGGESKKIKITPILLVTYFIVSALTFTLVGFEISPEPNDALEKSGTLNEKERIVLLLPLNKLRAHQEPAFQDGKRQAFGLIDLIENDALIQEKYEIIVIDHEMSPEKTISDVRRELSKGTKYFVSTMSHISKELTEEFSDLVINNYAGKPNEPKLIATVASSNELKLQKNLIYRYYIRSEDEAKKLGDYYLDSKLNNRTVSIVVDDNYGETARNLFMEEVGKPFNVDISLGLQWSKDQIKKKIESSLGNKPLANHTFLIVHYGSGLDNIISSLYELGHSGHLLISHPITVEEWQRPVDNALDNFDWTTCYVESQKGGAYFSHDIIRDFTYFTLHRFVQTIGAMNDSGKSFDEKWRECSEPERIQYSINQNGDSDIKLITTTYQSMGL